MPQKTALSEWIKKQTTGDGPYESLRDMADKTGIAVSTLSRWKNGQHPTDELFDRLADASSLKPWQLKKALAEIEQNQANNSQLDDEIANDVRLLPDDDKKEIRAIVRQKLENQRRKSA